MGLAAGVRRLPPLVGRAWAGRTAGTVAPANFPPCPWAGYLLGQANIFTKIKTKNATFHLRQQISGGSARKLKQG